MDPSKAHIIKRRKRLGWFLSKTNSRSAAWISYVSLALVSVLFSVFYLQSFFYLITILIISLPVLSYNITAPVIKKLSLSLKMSQDRLSIEIDNPGIIPVSCAEITLSVKSLFYGGFEDEVHSLSLIPRTLNRLSFPLTLKKYGIYEACAHDLVIYDPLHLFSFRKDINLKQSYNLLPSTPPRHKHIEIIYEEGFDEFTDTAKKGNASSNVTDIREYRPGDRLSRIHWKLTEKLDTLIVKENEATSSNEFTVLLELYQPPLEECSDIGLLNTLNDAIEEAWSVSTDLLLTREPFVFMFYNEKTADFVQTRIGCEEDLQDALTRACYAGCYTTKDLALSIYQKTIQDKGTLIHVG